MWVELAEAGLEDERVPATYFEQFRASRIIKELSRGEWMPGAKGKWRLGRET